jgi:hypothetical protein
VPGAEPNTERSATVATAVSIVRDECAATTKSLPHERRDMTDSSFTLLEVHLGDGDIEIGPFELFGATEEPASFVESGDGDGTGGDDEAADDEAAGDGEAAGSDGGVSARSVAGLLLALAALVAIAVGVAKLRGDDETPSGIAGDD